MWDDIQLLLFVSFNFPTISTIAIVKALFLFEPQVPLQCYIKKSDEYTFYEYLQLQGYK